MEKQGIAFIAAIVGLVVIVSGLSYLYIGSGQTGYENGNGVDDPNEGLQLAPVFTLPQVGGGNVMLADYSGKVLVLDFMATWCGPCVTEIGHLKEIDQKYGSDVAIVSIDVDRDEDDAILQPFIAQHGITWPVLRDTGGVSAASGYSASSIPTLVIVNQDGYIKDRFVGVTSASTLESVIDSIL
ncbi:MAG: hypothetical protein AYK23_00510 [Candidatus Proteinoplasmatales archaeon SG8-5]|nr:MAG: hypothetical protein AYK23_00510 [Candidatus Proteinoplasmatales archaeon SG8-5]